MPINIFNEEVAPRIANAEYHLEILRTRKIPYAIARDDFAGVGQLGEQAMELQESLVFLRALEGLPDGRIVEHLASL